jgi:hypothetical protein
VCTGVAPAEKNCTTGSDHFVNVTEVSTLVFVYPQFGDFRGRVRGILTGLDGSNANVRLYCDYTGDAAEDFVADNTGTACTTEASGWPDPGERFSYRCETTAYNSNSGNAQGRFFCGVTHT